MSLSAANPAGAPSVSLSMVQRANKSLPRCNGDGERHPSFDGLASSNRAVIGVGFHSQCADESFLLVRVCRFVSCLGRALLQSFSCNLGQLALLLRLPPCRLRFPLQIFFGETAEKISPESPQMQSIGTWEHGALAFCDPVKIGKFNKRRQSCTRIK
jgi:hypothetical protein